MLEAFFQHTIAPLAFLDRDFNFVRVNEAYARADGKGPEYFAGKNHFALYPNAENQAIFEQVVRTRQPYHAYARPFRYPDDPQRETYWNWQLTPLLDERGQVQFLVLSMENVTEQQAAFSELQERARQLQRLALELSQTEDRERKRIADILHDDLQQQLAAAKFHLGLLGNQVKDDTSLREATAQVGEMIKDAIATSRSLSHELSPAMLYHGDFGETLEWLANQIQAKHGLVVHVEVHGQIEVSSDPIKAFLFRTAQEILFNTVKHAGVTEAAIRLRRRNGQVRLIVCDRGRGFDPKTLGQTAGFGLLSIRERVELLGGHMKIRSTPGRGSTFLIAVPDGQVSPRARLVAEQAMSEVVDKATGRETGTCLRVLLADDHKVVREGLAILLNEQEDIEVVGQAANGWEAVDLAHKLQPDVVVMDVSMPVMEGDEATRQIKRHLPQTRVVALSMHDEARVMDQMCKAGASAYLLKTAPSEELLAAIRGPKENGIQ
jgi:PAS domain S-box-containing protein